MTVSFYKESRLRRTRIGEIPEDWQVVTLGSLVTNFISGGTPDTANPKYWNGDIPWLRSARLTARYVDSGEKNISKDGLKNSAANIVPRDNILIATRVSIGNMSINKMDVAISQDVTGAIVNRDKVEPEFLYWILRKSENDLKRLVQGSTISGILRDELKDFEIPLPPDREERERIVSILSTIDEAVERTEELKKRLLKTKTFFVQNILTGRIRVKPNVS